MSDVSVGPKERTASFGEGNRENRRKLKEKACENNHVCVRELPESLPYALALHLCHI